MDYWRSGSGGDTAKTPVASIPPGSTQLINYGAVDYPGAEALVPGSGLPRVNNFTSMSLGFLIFLPVLVFILISLCISLLYHELPGLCRALTVFSSALALFFMLVPQKQGDRPRYWFNLGFLCLLAVVASNLTGLLNFRRHFALYWAYDGQRDYTNVQPSDGALTHLDAGKLYFGAGAHVDTKAAFGLADGNRFCVAPIVGKTHRQLVEYWAAGVDCCDAMGQFTCGDVANKKARAGLVYLDYGPWQGHLAQFRKAAREAGGAHGLKPSEDALFMSWVEDPDQAQLWYKHLGMTFFTVSVFIHLAFSVVMGIMLHFRTPAVKKI